MSEGVIILLVMLSSLIFVPYIWVKLRGERSGYPEGRYPDPSIRPTPSEEYGEFKGEGLPQAEAGVFGPTRSSAGYRMGYFTQREWVHPDVYQYRKHVIKKEIKAEEKKEKDQRKEGENE